MKAAETYVQMKERHQKEVNEFPMMWAFNNDQFAQGMKKLGLQETDTDKIYRIAHHLNRRVEVVCNDD